MPRPKRTTKKQVSVLMDDKNQSTLNMSIKNGANFKLKMWKAEVRDKMRMSLKTLNDLEKDKLETFIYTFSNSLMAIPKSVLDTGFDCESEEYIKAFCNKGENMMMDEDIENISATPPIKTRTTKRRSRSASNVKNNLRTSQKIVKVRSSSIDVYKTPKGRVRLSSLMTNKKYTVTKPKKPENSGLHVKRIMKPDEEAISTCGSPLYVAPSTLGAPHVNIPLPGGVVINIEPKQAKGPLEVPGLDPETKRQIKILCEHLKNLF